MEPAHACHNCGCTSRPLHSAAAPRPASGSGDVGTVKFRDGSVVDIQGKGTVLFACRSGEHRRLDGVYYIPRLTTNIVSLGQMDEDGYKVNIESGILCLFDLERQLLAKVH